MNLVSKYPNFEPNESPVGSRSRYCVFDTNNAHGLHLFTSIKGERKR